MGISLRTLASCLVVALAAGPVAGTVPAEATPGGSTQPVALTLPTPTGGHRIGTVSLHLVDPSRRDPWVTGHPLRELMISLWYPATDTSRYPTAPWMPPAAASHYEATNGVPAGAVALPTTAGHVGAPMDRRSGPRPVIVYSPGSRGDRDTDTALVEQLASDGYVVVTIDHTHDAGEVEFPGGRVEVSTLPAEITDEFRTKVIEVRAADSSFVLNELTAINDGQNPSVEHASLPRGLKGALDLSRIGMFGHSDGGATTAAVMRSDRRVAAGVDMDGTLYGPVVDTGLNRPFLLLGDQHMQDPTWDRFLAHSGGWKRRLQLSGAEHLSFTDLEALYPQVARVLGLSPVQLTQIIGTIDPDRAITIERTYLRAFFDQHLRRRHSELLDGPSTRYPEIKFMS